MEYPHWLMVAGAVLVVVGLIGLALHKNYAEPVEIIRSKPRRLMSQTLSGRTGVELPGAKEKRIASGRSVRPSPKVNAV
jgi:hypothetical protein